VTDPRSLDDVVTADTVPVRLAGRHVAHPTDRPSIRSFVGGRFPRHRALAGSAAQLLPSETEELAG
jgi:hypothetical protein